MNRTVYDQRMRLPRDVPWWLLPNVYALDAPIVAAIWQRFLAMQFHVNVPVSATLALAAVVWALYLADRWLDARRGSRATDRHRIAARSPATFLVALVSACGLATLAISRLPSGYQEAGLTVGLAVLGYLAIVHRFSGESGLFPGVKELLVAMGFAAGVAIPLGVDGSSPQTWWPSVAAFGAVCFLNCRLIEHWEANSRSVPWFEGMVGLILLAGSLALPGVVGLAVASATTGLLVVHLACRNKPRAARVLADVVLLTPLVLWGWL